jgi:hypothetical protein
MDCVSARDRNLLGWMGTLCLLLIIPIKLLRHFAGANMTLVIGVAPSVLGPASWPECDTPSTTSIWLPAC